jgi:hypothetical protein
MATPSIFNKSYDPGSLAGRAAVPKGRSANDPQRMLERAVRKLRSEGKVVQASQMLQSQAWLDARLPGGRMMRPAEAPLDPTLQPRGRSMSPMPPAPAGNEEPAPMDGMDTPTPMTPEAPQTFENWFNQSPLAGAGLPPMNAGMPSMMVPADTPPDVLASLNQGAFAGAYTPAPKPYDTVPLPGTNNAGILKNGVPTGSVVSLERPLEPPSYQPVPGMPGLQMPMGPGADRLPLAEEVPNPGWSVTGQPKTKLQPVTEAPPEPKFQKAANGRMFWIESKPGGGYVRRWVEDADGDGVPDNQQGGAEPAAAAPSPARKPSSFLSFLP